MARYLNYVTTDVFTATPFAGNPLAIILLPPSADLTLTQAQKQLIAREFNYSETTFVHHESDCRDGERTVDIFTPETELPFAGHPTIGSSSYLLNAAAEAGEEPPKAILTKSGRIPISVASGSGPPSVTADIAHDTRLHKARFPATELLKLHPTLAPYVTGGCDFPIFSIVNGMSQIHVELPSLEALAAVTTTSSTVPGDGTYHDEGWSSSPIVVYFFVRGVYDEVLGKKVIRTRMIEGSLEDPATGSAASGLAAYLSSTAGKEGTQQYAFVQGVEMGRRSEIGVNVGFGDGKVASVELVGSAVEVSSGRIAIPQ